MKKISPIANKKLEVLARDKFYDRMSHGHEYYSNEDEQGACHTVDFDGIDQEGHTI